LGAFLRARRESLDPARVGLVHAGRRRRTPGLRREEVAQLADVGVTWYTWLEQGRAVRASVRALNAIAVALQCTEAESRHLLALANRLDAAPENMPACQPVSAAAQAVLDQFGAFPAMLVNARSDILGFNRAICRLMRVELGQLAQADRNCIYLGLSHPNWRASMAEIDDVVPRLVASFRAGMGEHLGDPLWEQKLQRFHATSPEFSEIWRRQEVLGVENHVKRFRHPDWGVIELFQQNWWDAPRNGSRMVVYVPQDAHAQGALEALATQQQGGPAAARRSAAQHRGGADAES
jgi:transcriptional regulator with XRE-family HTH domain